MYGIIIVGAIHDVEMMSDDDDDVDRSRWVRNAGRWYCADARGSQGKSSLNTFVSHYADGRVFVDTRPQVWYSNHINYSICFEER